MPDGQIVRRSVEDKLRAEEARSVRSNMSRRRAEMTADEIERARAQERGRQARRRQRAKLGAVLVHLPSDVADELGDDDSRVAARAVEILRSYLRRTLRDERDNP